MEKNQNGSGYIKRDCNTEDASKIFNCMCDDREKHSIECSKEYIFIGVEIGKLMKVKD